MTDSLRKLSLHLPVHYFLSSDINNIAYRKHPIVFFHSLCLCKRRVRQTDCIYNFNSRLSCSVKEDCKKYSCSHSFTLCTNPVMCLICRDLQGIAVRDSLVCAFGLMNTWIATWFLNLLHPVLFDTNHDVVKNAACKNPRAKILHILFVPNMMP